MSLVQNDNAKAFIIYFANLKLKIEVKGYISDTTQDHNNLLSLLLSHVYDRNCSLTN